MTPTEPVVPEEDLDPDFMKWMVMLLLGMITIMCIFFLLVLKLPDPDRRPQAVAVVAPTEEAAKGMTWAEVVTYLQDNADILSPESLAVKLRVDIRGFCGYKHHADLMEKGQPQPRAVGEDGFYTLSPGGTYTLFAGDFEGCDPTAASAASRLMPNKLPGTGFGPPQSTLYITLLQ